MRMLKVRGHGKKCHEHVSDVTFVVLAFDTRKSDQSQGVSYYDLHTSSMLALPS